MDRLISGLLNFAYYYPLFIAYVWMIGAIYYRFHWETSDSNDYRIPPELEYYPEVSILIPCYNEGDIIDETISLLFELIIHTMKSLPLMMAAVMTPDLA